MLASLATAATLATLGGCATTGYGNGYDNSYGYYDRTYYSQYGRYDHSSPDPRYNGYYADRYYHNDPRYRPRRLGPNDRIYRGSDGRYYCRRSDGTTGLIVGGYAGLEDKVNSHLGAHARGAAISSLLGVGANLTFTGGSDLVQAIRQSTEQNVARAGDQLISRNLSIPPTVTIRPGTPVRLLVQRDLVIAPPAN
jgi:hypothetical protein